MTLSPEWRDRINAWRHELTQHFFRELGEIEFRGFVTTEQLRLEEAAERPTRPMPMGTPWGAKWEYGWFFGELELPEEAQGRRIALRVDVGGEGAVYVNGVAAGACDRQLTHIPLPQAGRLFDLASLFALGRRHPEITLTRCGHPGERYEIAVEAYAGHGPRVAIAGPTPPERETVPEPPPTQAVVGRTTFGLWEEQVYQAWLDLQTLCDLRDSIDQDSLRVAEIDQGLRDFTLIVDPELPRDEFLETVRQGRERLKPLLECVNGSTAPTLYAFGHAHIDVAWLWPLAETERKCVRTFSNQLALAEEYPEYRFLQSQPHLYWMVKNHYPELYARMKEGVRQGQIMPEGGMWVEADTNISGGESLIRQFLYGKRFFKDEFGVDCVLLWLPDVFGYSGALPQIMQGCGIKYFSTAKIFWAYHGGQPFPYNTFTWEGIDGSEVKVHLVNDYNSRTDIATLIERWNGRVQKDGISTRLVPFGYGDGGGGPTRDHLEYLRRARDLEGVPKVVMDNPVEFFEDQERRGWPSERFVGELYFQAHRGTYTSQARTKRGNRKSEFALREAEMWAAAAMALAKASYPRQVLEEAWRQVLLNQFHDIIPGSSIHRVYEEAEAGYEQVMKNAEEVTEAAFAALTNGSEGLTVFNSLSWDRRALIALPAGWQGASGAFGDPLPVQTMDTKAYVEVDVPPCGWASVRPADPGTIENVIVASERTLENDVLRLEFNEFGEIVSIRDKSTGEEFAASPCNSLRLYKDVPSMWDAWDIDSMYPLTPVRLEHKALIEAGATGPLFGELQITRRLHNSEMRQVVRLRRGSRRVDFETEIDWQERHKLLKVAFPVRVHANEAVHEIQFGHIKRPNHYSMPYDADRFEVCNHKWTALVEPGRGCAVLNDCKYGVNVLGNSINLTLLRAPLAPDMLADRGLQRFTYAFYCWNEGPAASRLIREAYELNAPPEVQPGMAERRSLFSLDADNIVVETVKAAEEGSAIIVRLYESRRTATHCTLSTSLPLTSVQETDMLENPIGTLAISEGRARLEFRPFEIKTLRLVLA